MYLDESLELKLPKSKSSRLAQEIALAVREASRTRRAMDDKVTSWWERFEITKPKRTLPFDHAANVRVALTYWTIRSVWVREMRTIFGQDPIIAVGDENLSVGADASLAQEVLQHLFLVDLRLRKTEGQALLNSLVEGTGILKLGQDMVSRQIRDRNGEFLVERTVTDRVGLKLDAIDLKDFWVANPAIESIERQPWVAHRVWLRWDDLVRRQRDGIYPITKRQLQDLKPRTKTRRLSYDGSALEQAKADIDQAEDTGTGLEEYEILEVQYRTDVDGDGLEEECLFAVSPDYTEVLLRGQRAPWWNGKRGYFALRPLPRANRFYGMSLAGVLQGQQDEIDTRVNQNLDANTFAILAALTPILPRTLQQEWEKHIWQLGKPIYTDEPGTFATLGSIMKALPSVEAIDVQAQLEFSRQTSGVTEPFLGQPAGARTTAFEISTIQHEGNTNFQEMIEQVQEENRELGYQVLERAYQTMMEQPEFAERLLRVCGGKNPFEGLTLQDLRHRRDLKPYGNTIIANKDLEAKKAMAAFQLFKDDGFVNSDLTRARYLREKVLKGIGFNIEDIDRIIGSTEEVEAFKQFMATQAMQRGPELMNSLRGAMGQPPTGGEGQGAPPTPALPGGVG